MERMELQQQRLERWGQTPQTRITNPAEGADLIERVGLATLFPVSPEIPDLFSAYMGDPEAKTDAKWDSPSGEVYTWRWELGRSEAAFYTAIVRCRPTWVRWSLLPAVLRLRAELRPLEDLYAAGELSRDAYRVGQVLQAAERPLSTGELRSQAGFPTGKSERAAYLKAVEELDIRLLVAKVFSKENEDMYHVWVAARYPQQVEEAVKMTREQALDLFLHAYLPHAAYVVPTVLAKHLSLPEAELRAGLARLAESGYVILVSLPDVKGACYTWNA